MSEDINEDLYQQNKALADCFYLLLNDVAKSKGLKLEDSPSKYCGTSQAALMADLRFVFGEEYRTHSLIMKNAPNLIRGIHIEYA